MSKSSHRLSVKPEETYGIVRKWLHDDYTPVSISQSIALIGKEKIAEVINSLLQVGLILIEGISDKNGKVNEEYCEKLSAFILYHWDGTFTLRKSLINALCNFYNVSFVLLRCSLDMLLYGLFYQCLSQSRFRESKEIEKIKDNELKRLVGSLTKFLNENPEESAHAEKSSVYIFDLLDKLKINKLRPKPACVYKLLSKWGLFEPIEKPEKVIARVYGKLSFNVHQHYSTIDVGRAILEDKEIFEIHPPFLETSARQYLQELQQVLKLWTISELNLLKLFNIPTVSQPYQ